MKTHPHRPPIIGLTGGIGSGKSAATEFFAALGITVVDADVVSREVVQAGSTALARIAEHFGPRILLADGSLDRRALRQIIFSDSSQKQWLEELLHPLIRDEIRRQLQCSTSVYSILSSPLLLETGQNSLTDRILVIDAPEEEQIQRTRERDKTDAAAVEAIMASQWSRKKRLAAADDIISNTRDLAHLQREVHRLHAKYTGRACEQSTL